MSYHRPAAQVPAAPRTPTNFEGRLKPQAKWTARRDTLRPVQARIPLTRRYELTWLDETGEVQEQTQIAPALPLFEDAFASFTHGTLIQTTRGPVAVEDLQPGEMLECANGRVARLFWKGAITLVPGAPTLRPEPPKLYRVTADAFGLGRPARDLLLGPAARRLVKDPNVRAAIGAEAALVPVGAGADGYSIIEVNPVSATKVFHLVTEGHQTIMAGGVEVETYHPGQELTLSLSEDLRATYLQLFPHILSLGGFGRVLFPRLSTEDMADLF
ncbi:MAG: Hint domain-containing protein [Pseudomonadota bacterium]